MRVDLTLSRIIHRPKRRAVNIDFRLGSVADTLALIFDEGEIDKEQGFRLDQNQFILGQTEEKGRTDVPHGPHAGSREKGCLAGRVEGKSSLARFGLLVHFTDARPFTPASAPGRSRWNS